MSANDYLPWRHTHECSWMIMPAHEFSWVLMSAHNNTIEISLVSELDQVTYHGHENSRLGKEAPTNNSNECGEACDVFDRIEETIRDNSDEEEQGEVLNDKEWVLQKLHEWIRLGDVESCLAPMAEISCVKI